MFKRYSTGICLMIKVEYDDKYAYVLVTTPDEEVKFKFNTGNVVKDFKTAKEFVKDCITDPNIIGKVDSLMSSSSCNRFVFDNEGYGWKTDPELGDLIVKV